MARVHLEMIRDLQCPGCVSGCDSDLDDVEDQLASCPRFEVDKRMRDCSGHVAGTRSNFARILLGFPKGFMSVGFHQERTGDWVSNREADIEFLAVKEDESWKDMFDHLNIAVWAVKRDEDLFVRAYCPRNDHGRIIVIRGAEFEQLPGSPLDVSEFQDQL